MPCPQPDLPALQRPDFAPAEGIGEEADLFDASLLSSSPPIMVSDNPETVAPHYPVQAVLWRQILSGGSNKLSRLFFWHLNNMGANRQLGITVENKGSQPLQIISMRGEQGVSSLHPASNTNSGAGDFLMLGKCIAKAILGDTPSEISPVETSVAPGKVGVLRTFPWAANALLGGQYEILVQSAGSTDLNSDLDYVVRVVYAPPNHDLRQVTGDPVALNGPHARGSWAGSEIATTLEYEIPKEGEPIRQHYRLAKAAQSSRDFLLRATTTVEQPPVHPVVDNRANFGVTYHLRFVVQNFSNNPRSLHLFLNPRGGAFAGAIRIGSGEVHGIPRLSDTAHAVDLGILHCPPGVVTEQPFELMVAGACSTPVAIVVIPVDA